MLAVMVTVNTLDRSQFTASDDAANVRAVGLVCAAPATVMTPDANRLSTELEPALNRPITALVVFSPVMVALVDVIVVIVALVAVNCVIEPLAPRICEVPVVPMVVPVTVVIDALPPLNVVAKRLVIVPLPTLAVVIDALP